MKSKMLNALALVALVSASQVAVAEETSTTNVQTVAPSLVDKLALSYTGYFFGPSIENGQEDSSILPNAAGEADDFVRLDSFLTLGYKPTSDIKLAYTARFINMPFGTDYQPETLKSFYWKDHYAHASHKHFFQSGDLNSAWDLRFYIPTSDSSQNLERYTAVRTSQNTTYTLGDLTAGVYTFLRADLLGEKATGKADQLFVYAAPNAAYQMTKTVAATLWVDLIQLGHKKGGEGWTNDSVGIQPGVSWDITPKINVNPYLNFYPGTVDGDTTTVNMILSATVL